MAKIYRFLQAFLIAVAGVVLIPSQTAWAKTYYSTEVTNYVNIGDINISLNEYGLDDEGNEVPYEANQRVFPGQRVTEIVRVENRARDAWIRIKPELVSEIDMVGLDDSMIRLSSDMWVKRGEYYYYMVPVKTGEEIDFMDQVTIPWEWTEEYSDELFKLIITADAVQSEHFTPNFYSEDPWFGTIIEQCVHDSYIKPSTVLMKTFEVIFEGGADGLIRTSDDFFGNWGELMPGDVETGFVTVSNNYAKPVKIDFRTEGNENNELLKNLYIRIQQKNTIIYEGQLAGSVERPVVLGTFDKGDEARIDFTLTVPPELTNRFAMSTAKVKWIFRAEIMEEGSKDKDKDKNKNSSDKEKTTSGNKSGSSGNSSGNGGNNGSGGSLKDAAAKALEKVQTGDAMPVVALVAVLIAALSVILYTGRKKKDDKKEES